MIYRLGRNALGVDDSSTRVIVAYGVLFLSVLYFLFSTNVPCLFYGLDGASWFVKFSVQAARASYSQLGVDPLQGNFDAYQPMFREYFLPETLALLLTGSTAGKVSTYVAYGFLMLLSTYCLARSLELPRAVSFLAGSLFAAICLPTNFSSPAWIYAIYNVVPHLAQVTAVAALIVACFWAIDFRRPSLTVLLAMTSVALVILSIASAVTTTILMVPTIAVYAGASLFASRRRSDALTRLLLGAACVVIPTMLGMTQYARAVGGYTAYNFFSDEFMQSRTSLLYASILYNPELTGKIMVVVGLLGAALAVVGETGKIRTFAWTHIAATSIFQVVAVLVVSFAKDYHGPSPIYFEFMIWPIMFIFGAYAVSVLLRLTGDALQSVAQSGWGRLASVKSALNLANPVLRYAPLVAVPVFLATWNLSFAGQRSGVCDSGPFSPVKPNEITAYLSQTIAIRAGAPFSGLVATFDGVNGKSSVDWFDLHINDAQVWRTTGNDLRLVGLWWYNIPTLIQYSPTISPPYYLLLTDFLARSEDRQLRTVLVLTHPNERMLKLWGVRFVITDSNTDFGETRTRRPGPETDLRLVELAGPNLGNYSPTEVRRIESFRDGLRIMHGPDFDGSRTLVTDFPLDGTFVPAEDSKLIYEKTGFSVHAISSGRSILVLPVQYSRCWSAVGKGGPILFRANLMQLGVIFSGPLDANLVFRFGPFSASECRIEDIKDMTRLGIREARVH